MLGCKMLKTLIPGHQTIWLLTNSGSLLAHCFGINVVWSFWNININFLCINIG